MIRLIQRLLLLGLFCVASTSEVSAATPWSCTFYGAGTYNGCLVEVYTGGITVAFPYPVTAVTEVTCALCGNYVRQLLQQEVSETLDSFGSCYPASWCCGVLGNCPGGGGGTLPPWCERPRLHGPPQELVDNSLLATRVVLDGVLERSPYLTVGAHSDLRGFSCEGFSKQDLELMGFTCESAQALAYASMGRDGLIVGAPTMVMAYDRLAQELRRELRRLAGNDAAIRTDPRPPVAHLGTSLHVIAEADLGNQRIGIAWAEVPEYGDRRAFSFGPYPVFVVSVPRTDRTARFDQVGRAWSTFAAPEALRAAGISVKEQN